MNRIGWILLMVSVAGCAQSRTLTDAGAMTRTDAGMTDAGMTDAGPGRFVCSVDSSIDPLEDLLRREQSAGGCAGASCHGVGGAFGEWQDPETLIDLDSRFGCAEGGEPLHIIDSRGPSRSLLVLKLREETRPCGSVMPSGGTPLSDAEVACMTEYVEFLLR